MSRRKPSETASIQATHVADLDVVTGHWHNRQVTAGPHGDILVLASETPPVSEPGDRFGTTEGTLRVHHLRNNGWEVHDFPESAIALLFPCVQPIGQDAYVLIGMRSDPGDANAHVYNVYEGLVASFPTGDGIEDVQAAGDGIWVSYFDEGVCGKTMGREGVSCFQPDGEHVFSYNSLHYGPYILDCYAMNVVHPGEVWLYTYTDFPLVCWKEGELAGVWEAMPVMGSHAFAVHGNRVLFAGSYNDKEALFLVDLSDRNVRRLWPLGNGGSAMRSFTAFGRGHRLYLREGRDLYCVDLRHI